MSVRGMLSLATKWYRFCPVCGFPVGMNRRKGTLGMHARNRHESCPGIETRFHSLPPIRPSAWREYWLAQENNHPTANK